MNSDSNLVNNYMQALDSEEQLDAGRQLIVSVFLRRLNAMEQRAKDADTAEEEETLQKEFHDFKMELKAHVARGDTWLIPVFPSILQDQRAPSAAQAPISEGNVLTRLGRKIRAAIDNLRNIRRRSRKSGGGYRKKRRKISKKKKRKTTKKKKRKTKKKKYKKTKKRTRRISKK